MLPPFLKIMINEPGLLTEHLHAYSNLVTKDVRHWGTTLQHRLMLKVIMGGTLFLAVLFGGFALMIWGATDKAHWSLIVVPLIPLVIAITVAFMLSNKDMDPKPFESVKKQICADIRMFKEGAQHGSNH
jgi:hypothetical protein